MDSNGHAVRLNTKVQISLEIVHPEFIADDQIDGHLLDFKLVLQSVVCHRAMGANNSLESGHYVSLVRGEAPNAPPAPRPEGQTSEGAEETEPPKFMLFDDLAAERVTNVNIFERLEHETPYLLFYEIVPIGEDPRGDPPSYDEIHSTWLPDTKEDLASNTSDTAPSPDGTTVKSLDAPLSAATSPRLGAIDAPTIPRVSVEFSREVSRTTTSTADEKSLERRGRHSTSSLRRSDLNFTDGNFPPIGGLGLSAPGSISATTSSRGASAPTTPGEELESKGGLFGIGRRKSRREPGSAGRRSRPSSQVGDISRWFDNLVKKHSTEEIMGGGPSSTGDDSDLAKKLTLLSEEDGERTEESLPSTTNDAENTSPVATSSEVLSGIPQRKSSVFGSLRRAVKSKKDKEKEKSRERSKSRSRLGLE